MKLIDRILNFYINFLKKITTTIGTIIIYLTAILIGKVLYSFSKHTKVNRWSNYQSGSSTDKMY